MSINCSAPRRRQCLCMRARLCVCLWTRICAWLCELGVEGLGGCAYASPITTGCIMHCCWHGLHAHPSMVLCGTVHTSSHRVRRPASFTFAPELMLVNCHINSDLLACPVRSRNRARWVIAGFVLLWWTAHAWMDWHGLSGPYLQLQPSEWAPNEPTLAEDFWC